MRTIGPSTAVGKRSPRKCCSLFYSPNEDKFPSFSGCFIWRVETLSTLSHRSITTMRHASPSRLAYEVWQSGLESLRRKQFCKSGSLSWLLDRLVFFTVPDLPRWSAWFSGSQRVSCPGEVHRSWGDMFRTGTRFVHSISNRTPSNFDKSQNPIQEYF